MTSKEALELLEMILQNHSSMLEVTDKRFEFINVIKEYLEALEKENQQLLVNKNVAQALAIKLNQENENIKKHNARLTRKIQNLYKEHATLIGDLSLLRSNNEALLKLIGGIEVINNE